MAGLPPPEFYIPSISRSFLKAALMNSILAMICWYSSRTAFNLAWLVIFFIVTQSVLSRFHPGPGKRLFHSQDIKRILFSEERNE